MGIPDWLLTFPYHWLLPLSAAYALGICGLVANALAHRQRAQRRSERDRTAA